MEWGTTIEKNYIHMYFYLQTLLGSDHILKREGEEGDEEQGQIFSWPEEKGWCIPEEKQMEKDCKAYCFLAIHTLSKTYNIHAHSEDACLKGLKIKDLFFLTFLHCEAKYG